MPKLTNIVDVLMSGLSLVVKLPATIFLSISNGAFSGGGGFNAVNSIFWVFSFHHK